MLGPTVTSLGGYGAATRTLLTHSKKTGAHLLLLVILQKVCRERITKDTGSRVTNATEKGW